ncbi:hypothetical protein Agabi119p4_3222 [Agaricus bisporus var. burnettii]|uniref:25S rRNA adenine-N(1) methyltransferase n=1 Tax=Agaricus bisporus var. burnettii TaxID=192524 RepID=A0A8H7F6N4_AGABI|nr:hypothetical protein Agabi119p4_3222 [Agaricus bisporus var. burnettii]
MPKTKKRKLPISNPLDNYVATSRPQSSRNVIRRFHVLIKKEAQLKCNRSPSAAEIEDLVKIQHEIQELGGLQRYQRMSTVGQSGDRGGGSEKVFIEWMKELKLHVSEMQIKLRLLEVGALKPDNFTSCTSWIENTPIDLRPQHPAIREQDFLLLDPVENERKWDAISLSLVLNFVPLAVDRGSMLQLANTILKDKGYLFLALPLPCLTNSRYMSFEHFTRLMETLGFSELRCRWKKGGKMAYWLYQKQPKPRQEESGGFVKKVVLRHGNRNNFAVLLKNS